MTDVVPARAVLVDPAHPAAKFGEKARAAGWTVEYRGARGPVTVRRRPAEPNEQGKYALVEVTTTEDTTGARGRHPDGRALAAWWIGTTFGEGWAASPRRNARQLGIRALTAYLTEDEIEEENVSTPEEKRAAIEGEARAAWVQLCDSEVGPFDEDSIYSMGYLAGHAAAAEKAGDAYGEGYAAGVAAVAGHGRVWVTTRRRLDALRPGDVILGKGAKWWVVDSTAEGRRQVEVHACSRSEWVTVAGDAKRLVDVVEPIDLADALAALKDADMGGERIEVEA